MEKGIFNLKIRPTIMLLFFITVSIVATSIMALQYKFSLDIAKKGTTDSFNIVSQNIVNEIKQYDTKSEELLQFISLFDGIKDTPKFKKKHKLIDLITTIINNTPYLYSFYVGHKSGYFYQVINLDISKSLAIKLNAPKGARYLVVKIDNKTNKYNIFLDKNLNVLKTKKENTTYKPYQRPWFKKSMATNSITKTQPYIFTSLNSYGVTYAKKVSNKIVVGVDITLQTLNTLLNNQKLVDGTYISLFREDGQITAYSKLGNSLSNGKNIYTMFPNQFDKQQYVDEPQIVKIDADEYFKYYVELKSNYDFKEYIAILSPLDTIMQPYIQKIITSIFVSILIFIFIGIPLILYASRLIIRPIQDMEIENEKIKNRKYDEVKFKRTFITELNNLSISLLSMTKSIKAHEESQKELMNSFIKLIASTIDAKSKYTGGHCNRVPELSILLMQKANEATYGEFADFTIENKDQLEELNISAWLHDCGKVVTPEYVVDKATKLETIYNIIHEIRMRFEVLYRDRIIQKLKEKLEDKDIEESLKSLDDEYKELSDEFAFIANANEGDEFMNDEDKEKIKELSQRKWTRYFDDTLGLSQDEIKRMGNKDELLPVQEKLLEDKDIHIFPRVDFDYEEYKASGFKMDVPEHLYNQGEVYNLCINRGTLTDEERFKINEHVIMSIKMLEELPFPDYLKNVPLYAGAHHETLIGTGYPRKLTKEDMPLPSRIIALADIFEALTAADRPYKEAKKLSQSIKILSFMVKDKHIDEDLFKLFLSSGAYLEYANKYLKPSQIDEVNIEEYL